MALTNEIIGKALRDARKEAGLTQASAAKAIGINRTVMSKIEKGN